MEDKVRKAARHHIASFKDNGKCDFIRDFAFPFPVSIFLDLIDLPHEDTARFMAWEHDLLHESDLDTVGNAVRNVTGYMREVIADRRRNPRDDFISYGIQAELRGRPLTDDELIGYTFNLFIGGPDKVRSKARRLGKECVNTFKSRGSP